MNKLVIDFVDDCLKSIMKQNKFHQEFCPFDYILDLFLNIAASLAIGTHDGENNQEYIILKEAFTSLSKQASNEKTFLVWELFPVIRKFDAKFKNLKLMIEQVNRIVESKILFCDKEQRKEDNRNFCDFFMEAKLTSIDQGKNFVNSTKLDLTLVIFDLFLGGTETSQATFKWLILYILSNNDVEMRLRKEIEDEIGDRLPTHEDKNRCHFVMAVISETLRLNNVVPLALPHKTLRDSIIGVVYSFILVE